MYTINGDPERFADLGVFHKLSQQFVPFAQKRLGFDKPVGINLISDPENAKNPLAKTAQYDPNNMQITVFVDKRHVKDILRSMSHELVHHAQNCRGDLAGEMHLGPGYAQEDGHMREMEREAYEEGQMILRDFEDKTKKENKVMSEQKKNKPAHKGTCKEAHGHDMSEAGCRAHVQEMALREDDMPGTGTSQKPWDPATSPPEDTEKPKERGEEITDPDDITLEEEEGAKKSKWKNPDGETGVVLCDPDPCTEKEAGDKIRSRSKAKATKKPDKAPPKKKRERVRFEEKWTRKNKDQLLFERLTKLWTSKE